MSADNEIAILQSPLPDGSGFEYRVAHMSASEMSEVEQYDLTRPHLGPSMELYHLTPEEQKKYINNNYRFLFKNAPVFTTEKEANNAAFAQEKDCGYVEYGVCGPYEMTEPFVLSEEGPIIHPTSELAHQLSVYVHDNCSDVPHDIGLKLVEIVRNFMLR